MIAKAPKYHKAQHSGIIMLTLGERNYSTYVVVVRREYEVVL